MKTRRTIPLKYNLQFLDDYWIYSEHGINSELHNVEYPYKHFHTFYEIVIILKGEIEHCFTDQKPDENLVYETELLHADTVQIIPPELIHYYRFISDDAEYINITLSKQVFHSLLNCLELNRLNKFPCSVEITPENLSSLLRDFQEIFSAEYSEEEKAQLNKILAINSLKSFVRKTSSQSRYPQWLTDLLICLEHPHYLDKNIEELVKVTHYSHSQLCKLFKAQMGTSLKQYLNKKRIEYACHLLKNSDVKIITIATTLGYDSHSFFSKFFSDNMGITPQQYRNKFRK